MRFVAVATVGVGIVATCFAVAYDVVGGWGAAGMLIGTFLLALGIAQYLHVPTVEEARDAEEQNLLDLIQDEDAHIAELFTCATNAPTESERLDLMERAAKAEGRAAFCRDRIRAIHAERTAARLALLRRAGDDFRAAVARS